MAQICAVVDCTNEGRPQACPYDGASHYHGLIHYENDHPAHPELRFRPLAEGWLFVCNQHVQQIRHDVTERRETLAMIDAAQR